MGKIRGIIKLMLVTVLLASVGCDNSAEIVQPPSALDRSSPADKGIALPAPSRLRQAAAVTPGVFRYGSQYSTTFPNQLVSADGHLLAFTPAWSGNGLGGAAYAIYAFDSTGYTSDDTVHLAWQASGAATSDLWIGLANFTRDRWDWFAGPANDALPYDSAKYTSDGLVYAIVLCLDNIPWKLSGISISPDVQPVVLIVNPPYCTENVPITFTAEIQGLVDSYSWDFGGGATPNTSTASAPEVIASGIGTYQVTLAVANTFGQDVFSFILHVSRPVLSLSLTNPPGGGAGTVTDPFRASVSFDYKFQLVDSLDGDVSCNANTHYDVSDEVNVGSISNLNAILCINNDFVGSFSVSAEYPDPLHSAHPTLYFTVDAPTPELEIYPDPGDPDWAIVTGSGTIADPYILDQADLTRLYSLLADDKIGIGGNQIPVDVLIWEASPPLIATWTQQGEFRAELYANGSIYATKSLPPHTNSNKVYIKLY